MNAPLVDKVEASGHLGQQSSFGKRLGVGIDPIPASVRMSGWVAQMAKSKSVKHA
jgi:hypothetical protein